MDLANLIILALFVEAIVQTVKPIWDKTAGNEMRSLSKWLKLG